ncbi:hypothetical protein C2G38_2227276 [Gigaspora rosea]|uniref:BTB domain-containing protein n=1 Tax=Gigaspora rosea TaxID=44941 RepID=A0A397TX82_9GLOM|nr:hypothetical protein C2G38_2227276 [Gigaspora rosea]
MTRKIFIIYSNYLELNDEEDFNIIINIGESPDTKIFRAHSIILKYRSLYFCNELANINSDENHVKMVNLKHISTQQFEIIINYLELLNNEEDFNIIINIANINSDKNNVKTVNLKHVSTQQFEILSSNYLELLNDEEDFNIIINVGESPNTKIF